MNEGFEDLPREVSGNTLRLGARHAALDDFTLALVVPQRGPGVQFELTNFHHYRLALCDQINDFGVNLIQTLAQFNEAFGRRGVVFGYLQLPFILCIGLKGGAI